MSTHVEVAQNDAIYMQNTGLKRGSKDYKVKVYDQILDNMLSQITETCHAIGATDGKGGAEKAHAASKKEEHDLIDHGPIFLALLVVLFTGQNSSYHTLANDMANLNKIMKQLGQYGGDIKKILDELNQFMKGDTDGETPAQIAKTIAALQAHLQELLKNHSSSLSPALKKAINDFVKPGGTLDQLVADATKGMSPPCSSWTQAANNPEALKKIKDYLVNSSGGAAGKGATTIFSKISSLLGSVNTANQADIEKLNLITKKVDADTKLMSSVVTLYKGLVQTLTNYSGS